MSIAVNAPMRPKLSYYLSNNEQIKTMSTTLKGLLQVNAKTTG